MRSRLARVLAFARRHRLAVALTVAVVLRVALPYAVRPLLERQASATLNADVRIGDVDLALYRAGIALDDVAIRPAGWTPETDSGEPPLIAWKRLGLAVRWLPLVRKTVQLRELLLDSPRIAIDRLQDGGLNLMALVPKSEPAAAEDTDAGRSGWTVGIDRFVLRDGGVRFRDLMFARVEPVELSLGSFEVDDIALSPSVYGGPATVHLEARVDDGRFVLDASLTPREGGGFALASHLKARRLPLRRTRVYVPKVGWSELEGEFGGALDYALETGGRNDVRGQVTVDGLRVHTSQLEGPGLAWKRLAVLVDPIDLAARRAVVRSVQLEHSYLVTRARGGVVFPFIEAVLTGEPAGSDTPPPDPAPAPTPTPVPPPPPAQAAPPPWTWQVDRIDVWDSLMHVISPDASFDAGCTLGVRNLRSEGADPATIALALGIGEEGTVAVDGRTHIQPLGFAGDLKAAQVPLPDILATFGVFPPGVAQRARLQVDLDVAAGTLAPSPGDVRVAGTVAVDEPYLVGAAGPTSDVGAKRVAVGIGELLLPGGLAAEPPAVAADARLTGGSLVLEEPWALRTESAPFDVRAALLDVAVDELTAPGVGPAPADGGTLLLRGRVRATGLAAADAGGSGLDVGAQDLEVVAGELVVPGLRAADPAAVAAPVRLAKGSITLAAPRAAGRGPRRLDTGAQRVALTLGEVTAPRRGATSIRLRDARLALADPRLLDTRGDRLDARARGIEVTVGDLQAPAGGGLAGTQLRRARVALADPAVTGPDAKTFAVGARAIAVGIDDVAIAAGAPARVRLREVALTAPRVQVTRTAGGLLLPGGASPSPTPSGTPPAAAVATAPPAPATAAPATAAPTAPGIDLAVASFRLTDGRIGITDRSVKPAYVGVLAPLAVELRGVRWPAMEADRVRIDATTADRGTVAITGALARGAGTLEVRTKDVPLKPFSPYAASASPYSIRRGQLSVTTKATFGQGKYDSDTTVVLHDFDLGSRSGDSLFKEQFGIPLSMALALLRDLNGDIKLAVPVEGDEKGMQIGYRALVASALRSALLGALSSPLKLVGAVFSGDKVQAAPEPIGFRLGREELTDDGAKQVGQIAKFLADRPAMGVALATAPTAADARWLHEHEVVQELGAPPGVFGRVWNLVQRGRRDRIRQALDARAEGKPGELGPDDQNVLDEWLAEKPKPTPEQLRALAETRLSVVERTLRDTHGIGPGRIVRREPPAAAADAATPTVDIELGSIEDLTAPPEDDGPSPAPAGAAP